MKILVVDDNLTAREAISNFLGNLHDVIFAKSLTEGVSGLDKEPDLVIADWDLGNNTTSAAIVETCIRDGIRVVIQTGTPYIDELDSIREKGVEIIDKLDLRNEIKGNLESMGGLRRER